MKQLEDFLKKYPGRTFFLLILIAFPIFLTNLGMLALYADEPTRANVALEMILSGNYSVPTIGSEFYYNKPPLYNWILAGLYNLSGSFSEFVTRLPAVIPLFLFAITVFLSVRHFLNDNRIAAVSGLLLLINGRMLIYDSLLGHIDIFYSWLTYSSFILIFYFFQRRKWVELFLSSYLITAITFLAKGLPSIVFQGITLITLLFWSGNFKKLFSWQHIVSGIICLAIIGAYFYNYYLHNPNLEGYLATIWDQSSRRTAVQSPILDTVVHIVSFPFEHAMHLFPASLLLLFCFHKNFLTGIRNNHFLTYISLIFLTNIMVYVFSPETRPRYLFMLYPLLFIVWSHAYFSYRKNLIKINRTFEWIILTLAFLVTCFIPSAFFIETSNYIPNLTFKVSILFLLSLLTVFSIWKLKESKFIAFIAFLLVVRLGFSLLVIPYRTMTREDTLYKNFAIEISKIVGKDDFYFYQYHPAEAMIPFHDKLIFYIQRTRMKQVKFVEDIPFPGYYFTFDREVEHPDAVLVKSYQDLKLYQIK